MTALDITQFAILGVLAILVMVIIANQSEDRRVASRTGENTNGRIDDISTRVYQTRSELGRLETQVKELGSALGFERTKADEQWAPHPFASNKTEWVDQRLNEIALTCVQLKEAGSIIHERLQSVEEVLVKPKLTPKRRTARRS